MCYITKNNLTGYHTELDRKSLYKKNDPEFHMLQVFICSMNTKYLLVKIDNFL